MLVKGKERKFMIVLYLRDKKIETEARYTFGFSFSPVLILTMTAAFGVVETLIDYNVTQFRSQMFNVLFYK